MLRVAKYKEADDHRITRGTWLVYNIPIYLDYVLPKLHVKFKRK